MIRVNNNVELKISNPNLGLVKNLINDGKPFGEEGEFTLGEFECSDISRVTDDDWGFFFIYGIETTRSATPGRGSLTAAELDFRQKFQNIGPLSILISKELYKELVRRESIAYMHFRNFLCYMEYTYNISICERDYLKPNQYAYVGRELFDKEYR